MGSKALRTTPAATGTAPSTLTPEFRCCGKEDTRSTGRSGRRDAWTRRNTQRDEQVTVQGLVKKLQPDGLSHGGGGGGWQGLCSDYYMAPSGSRRHNAPRSSTAAAVIVHCPVGPVGLRLTVQMQHRQEPPPPPPRAPVRSPRQEHDPADAHPSAHKSVLESANPRMDSEGASRCPWSTARATARLRDGRPPE